jgi:hypothetical protein
MHELLDCILDAHGGLDRWRRYELVDATIVSGGGFFSLKGIIQDSNPRQVRAALHEQRISLKPYGAPDQLSVFTPELVTVEREDGTVLAKREMPREGFAGHQMNTAWDPLHRAYFNGEALWTYFATPFLLAMPGVRIEELEPWREGNETWRCLRAYFPASLETHSQVQEFFFGSDFLLRRHDYRVNIAGGFPAAQLTTQYASSGGIRFPTRRRAYTRSPDGRPVPEMLMVNIDLSNVQFS